MTLRSPVTGAPLQADTPHSLAAPGERWPVVDGIPYLRTGREALVSLALQELDAGRRDEALIALLADQDDHWTGPVADAKALRRLVEERAGLTLRGAMALLGFGPVADYFAHRWSDPTYFAGLALLEAYWNAPDSAFELACGIGHYLRELARFGVDCTGADVVFAKCWLARHWVAPGARYVVFDAAGRWPLAGERFDLVLCQDAFYFLPEQERVAQSLRDVCGPGGRLAIGHLHNADYASGALGPARPASEWQALFPAATVYDERELRRALIAADTPRSGEWTGDPQVEAWSIVENAAADEPHRLDAGIAMPPAGVRLVRNPLLDGQEVRWPSDRYEREYADASTWAGAKAESDPVRTRRLIALPERW